MMQTYSVPTRQLQSSALNLVSPNSEHLIPLGIEVVLDYLRLRSHSSNCQADVLIHMEKSHATCSNMLIITMPSLRNFHMLIYVIQIPRIKT